MKKKLLKIKILAEGVGKHQSTVYRWFTGARGITKADSVDLERATGIKAEAWLFPEKYGNPYFEKKKGVDVGNI